MTVTPGLYLHVPFCRSKCPYCDFFSIPGASGELEAYPGLLLRQLEQAAAAEKSGPFETVFFGGGTPSLLPPAAVGRILEGVARCFGLAEGAEISLEANPGTVTPESLRGYRAAGVNRLSLGLQSLEEESLAFLGRSHTASEALAAAGAARDAGFSNLSCDLIFALPGQSSAVLQAGLEAFLALEPEHLSCYGLTVEEGTPFHHRHRAREFHLPEEEVYAEQYHLLHRLLSGAGYGHYEVANYARPGLECRHNLGYWRRRGYLGLGAGAHSFSPAGWGERRFVPSDLEGYRRSLLAGEDPAQSLEIFDRKGAMSETLYLGLRTSEGVLESAFRERFGQGVAEAFPEAVRRAKGNLLLEGDSWRFSPQGWLLYDYLISPFLG